jgi:hypothetical protein
MQKSFTRRLVLAIILGTLSGTIAHADTTTPPPPPTPSSVTGGDPVPTSPHVVTVILTLLQVLL